MATVPAWFRTAETPAAREQPPQSLPAEGAGLCRLRPLPNEDVYFYRKRIDNSRVVREADPIARKKCWRAIAVCCLAVTYLILLLVPDVMVRIAGYQLHSLQRQHETLVNEKAALELQEAGLLSPERLDELARTLQLVDPVPGQVILLNPKADGSLAFHVRSK